MESLSSILSLDKPICCYMDFKFALFWIIGEDKEWKQFVQNHVLEEFVHSFQLPAGGTVLESTTQQMFCPEV